MHVEEIIKKFRSVKKIGTNSYQCICPCHNDKQASLTVTEENDKILLYCHAGCSTKDILSSIGLKEKDLFNNTKEKPKIIAEYVYRNEKEEPLYKVIKFEPKNFMQAKYEKGKWIWKMDNVRYVLYNLSNVIKSDTIFFVEGEKDADNLNNLGLCATTTVGGASSFNKRAGDYIPFLKDKNVYIIPDNDKAGYKYSSDIEKALKTIVSKIRVLKLADFVEGLKEKQDISDVILKYGKEKTLELIKEMCSKAEKTDVEELELDVNNVISIELFEKLYRYELTDLEKYFEIYNQIKIFCQKNRITGFDKNYKKYKENKQELESEKRNSSNLLVFPELDNIAFKTNKYEIDENGFIYEVIPDVGKILVCYHPILPVEKFKNVEDGTEKIKIGFYKENKWNYLTVEKSVISSSQSIVKLSDLGISVTSENAKHLVKYLAEIENLNKDLIKTDISTSKLGWIDDNVLMPYSDNFEFDNEIYLPNIREKFGESGKLEDWINFFKDRRKYNPISRIVMAAAVASILLKKIKQTGFVLHIYGTSEYRKNSCLYGRSINIWKS